MVSWSPAATVNDTVPVSPTLPTSTPLRWILMLPLPVADQVRVTFPAPFTTSALLVTVAG